IGQLLAKIGKFKKVVKKAPSGARNTRRGVGESKSEGICRIEGQGCFIEGTLVETAEGFVEIQTIEAGDEVWSINPETGEWGLQEVLTPLTRSWVGDMVTVTAAEEEIEATGNHPFWVLSGDALASRPEVHELAKVHEDGVQGRWVEARHLRVGDWLLLRSGAAIKVRALEARVAALPVYNLDVAHWHTYTVSQHRVLVHNYDPKKGTKKSPSDSQGRAGRQQRLREMADDPKLGRAVRGWIKQEINATTKGNRKGKKIRVPPGMQLAHPRGREAAKGFSHVKAPSKLQDVDLHKLQHKHDNMGRNNALNE
ncbi:MAG: hypothetical protein KDB07_07610, partial [Planctomycetes bacterium]|nr:hypothetical protein [Planctomycetota bacterium]